MRLLRDIWLCEDCTAVAVNGDYSGLDYYLSEKQAARKAAEIDAGLDNLPGLTPDWNEETEYTCSCGFIGTHDQLEGVARGDDDDFEFEYVCPECGDDVSEREHGEREFTRYDCDCCGTDLAGRRMRFACVIREESES